MIKAYSEAIEDAMRIAVDKNLDTIPEVTYIFVWFLIIMSKDVSGSMCSKISGGKK